MARRPRQRKKNKSNWYLIWNMIHPCIYIYTPDFELTPVKTEPLLRFPCHIYNFDKFARKIIITIPFSPYRGESQYEMHPVRDVTRKIEARTQCVWKLSASFPIHFDGRYYIDYISMHTVENLQRRWWWLLASGVWVDVKIQRNGKCDGCVCLYVYMVVRDRCKIVGYYYLYWIDRGANKIVKNDHFGFVWNVKHTRRDEWIARVFIQCMHKTVKLLYLPRAYTDINSDCFENNNFDL